MQTGRKKLARPTSDCHPDKPAFRSSGGLCILCYKREWAREKRRKNPLPVKERKPIMATCHPDKPHWGKGLCIPCYGKYYRQHKPEVNKRAAYKWRKANTDKLQNKHLRRYGLSLKLYNGLLLSQGNACKLCGKSPPKLPIVEHDHKTGNVRGIVCQHCNMAIGWIENYKHLLDKVPSYLEGVSE